MKEIDQEELITALEHVIDIYDAEIEPFAVELTSTLVENYKRLQKEVDDKGETMMAASSCVSAIFKIIQGVRKHKECLGKIEEVVFPVILHSMTPDGVEHVEHAMDCATGLIYYQEKVSEKMWRVFESVLVLVAGDENDEEGGLLFDTFENLQVFIFNCIKYGKEEFIKGRMEDLLRFMEKMIEISRE